MAKHINIGMGAAGKKVLLDLRMANRHGLIAGATGTGKTVTLQTLAEQFSRAGVPVFATDIKGDLAGIGYTGEFNGQLIDRALKLGLENYVPKACPVETWDLFGAYGKQIRVRVGDMGPLLMSRLLNLTPTQSGVLNVLFIYAEDKALQLNSLHDFREVVRLALRNTEAVSATYGYVTASTLSIVQRGISILENQGGDLFFGIPEFDVHDLIKLDGSGEGVVNLLHASSLMDRPQVYAAFIMWLMQQLFNHLPEVGDPDKPKIVFFFDEAHLIFKDAPKQLLDSIERVVRLIRSKGVGIYFVTQSPLDVPEPILAQLGSKVQHALRAFTAKDARAVRAAAESFRPNPKFKTADAIISAGKGQALVSTLDLKGIPTPVELTHIYPPESFMGFKEPPAATEVVQTTAPGSEDMPPMELDRNYSTAQAIDRLSVFVFGMVVGGFLMWLF